MRYALSNPYDVNKVLKIISAEGLKVKGDIT